MNETLLDAAVFDDLVEHIGADAVRAIVEIFFGECRELAGAIAAAAAAPRVAARAAHSLKSSAGQLGASALAAAALAVETAATEGSADLPPLAAALVACAERTEAALAARLNSQAP
jgi:HPt (histidine-containing phosphotransfer) domain-containing protein